MAAITRKQCVRFLQRIISEIVIELFGYQLDDISVTSLMFGVTAMALHFRLHSQLAVKAFAAADICSNVLMAIHAQGVLTGSVASVMAVGAFAFYLGVRAGYLSRHQ